MALINRAAIIGGGVIGAGWIARLIENGVDVSVYDPADDAQQKVDAVLHNSRRAYEKLIGAPRASEGSVSFSDSIAAAVDFTTTIESGDRKRIGRLVDKDQEYCIRS